MPRPKYGKISGPTDLEKPIKIGASEVFKQNGGAFMTPDGSGYYDIAGASDANVTCYALVNADVTAPSTDGAMSVVADFSEISEFEIPINSGTWADTMKGKTCDLSVVSDVQGAALDASTYDNILLVDKGFTNAAGTVVSVKVKRYPLKHVATGVV